MTTDPVTAELLSRKIAHTYPSASADDSGASPSATSELTVPEIVTVNRPRGRLQNTQRSSATAPRRRRRPSVVRAVVGFALLVGITQLAPRASEVVGRSLPNFSFPQWSSPAETSTARGKDCQELTRTAIAEATNAKVVLEQARAGDVCAWWLAKPQYANQRADVTLTTGTSVRVSLSITGSTESRIDMMPGEVTAWLPEHTALPGWKTSSKATQALSVSLRFSYPEGATPPQARAKEAAAERTVTRLAEQAAIALAGRTTAP